LVKFKRIFLNYLLNRNWTWNSIVIKKRLFCTESLDIEIGILNEIIRYYIEMKGFWNK